LLLAGHAPPSACTVGDLNDASVVRLAADPAIISLCRNATTDAGWPLLQSCAVLDANASFTTRTRPGS
jgi:hypothetical protein